MRSIRFLAVLLGALAVSACGVSGKDLTPDYRYRLTVEVDTPEGLKTGSGVIEIRQRLGRSAANPANGKIGRRVRGEAVAVDMPDGKVLFALLRSDDNIEWASYIMQWLAPKIEGEPWAERFDNMLMLEGEVVIPSEWPKRSGSILHERASYPMLVTFEDISDPTTVTLVDPDDLAATFGEGTAIRRITVQLTDEPVSIDIEQRLEWLSQYPEPRLDPDYRGSTNPNLAQSLWHGDFRKGNAE